MVGQAGGIRFAQYGVNSTQFTRTPRTEEQGGGLSETTRRAEDVIAPDDYSGIIAGDQRGGEANGRSQVFLNNQTHNEQGHGAARTDRQGEAGTADKSVGQAIQAAREDLARFDNYEGVDVSYTVQSGDTLTDIAQGVVRANTGNLEGDESTLDGVEVGRVRDAIIEQNGLTLPGNINTGQALDLTGIVSRLPNETEVEAETEVEEPAAAAAEAPTTEEIDAIIAGADQNALSALDGNQLGALNNEEKAYIRGELEKGVTIEQLVATGNLLEPATLDPDATVSDEIETVIGDSTNLGDITDHEYLTLEEFEAYEDLPTANPKLTETLRNYFSFDPTRSIAKWDIEAAEAALEQGFAPEHIVSLLDER